MSKRSTSIQEVEDFLNANYEIRLNEVNYQLEVREFGSNEPFYDLNENDIFRDLHKNYKGISMSFLMAILKSSYVNKYNPLFEFFESIKELYNPQESIDYIDKLTGRRISNIVQVAPETDALLGAASEIHARSGLGVNGNHANDATLVRQFHLWGKKNNIDTATIHDAFFTNVAHSHKIKPEMQKLFAQALESDTIRNTLKEMKKRGLPNSEYKRLLKEAEDRGLLDGGLTKQDILRVMESNEEFYGIGP